MITMIPRSKLEPHPDNPRRDLGDLSELAASIKATSIVRVFKRSGLFSALIIEKVVFSK